MTSTAALAEQYFAMWNEDDTDVRAGIVANLWVDEAMYVDPSFDVTGHDDLTKMVETAHQMFPGYRFTQTGTIDEHHNRLRWTWELAQPGHPAVAGGTDLVTIAPNGKILEVVGFHDFAPSH
ncbi:nuclear transport factor 2 family protein [Kribbella qitaiheensis]|uniref:Nuclear transport factor 2 family protein n=1 Tax=Kribbella qitaiheensis TaxID=1544730 RepID=A0A7G6X1P5_9ACTN|nr:nuclear transport factor 2 family protein [Kribbella qitaiheensis]QNE20160.1 nuclear transport factor 2 family protein [Kribbella qitaiheensis]